MPSFALTSGRKFSTTTSAFSASRLKTFKPPGILQVERHRPLVAVQVLEIRAMARPARLLAGGILYQGVDLDDVGAPIRELAHAGRPGADAGEVEHGEAGQGLRGAREGHSVAPM